MHIHQSSRAPVQLQGECSGRVTSSRSCPRSATVSFHCLRAASAAARTRSALESGVLRRAWKATRMKLGSGRTLRTRHAERWLEERSVRATFTALLYEQNWSRGWQRDPSRHTGAPLSERGPSPVPRIPSVAARHRRGQAEVLGKWRSPKRNGHVEEDRPNGKGRQKRYRKVGVITRATGQSSTMEVMKVVTVWADRSVESKRFRTHRLC